LGAIVTLEPLLNASLPVQIHVATVVPAFVLGTWQIFFSAKGTPFHRGVGYTYLTLMTITAISTLWIREINPDGPFFGLSWIHLFVPLTLFGVVGAIATARRHDIKGHRRAMIGVYAGALLIAGGLAFLPGRIMHEVVFGT
jgi:uncharacterized membrane protein